MPKHPAPILAILEGKWFKNKNVSVREVFAALFAIWTPNEDRAHHYEMFTNDAAFRDAILHAFGNGRAKTIYVAAHGDWNAIHGFHDQGITRAKIRHAFRSVNKSVARRGVYFGSCQFGTPKNAKFILGECDCIAWIAGYSTLIDWIDSTVLDMFFFRNLFFPSPGRGKLKPTTPSQRLEYAVRRVCDCMPELARSTGFHVYTRKKGVSGEIKNLVATALSANR